MLDLGFISFAAPWALAMLASLPLIWWLLRVTPPIPKRVKFPAIQFLFGLQQNDHTSSHTPWWLLLLRLATAAIVIIALADPILNRNQTDITEDTVVFIVDDGWTSSTGWPDRIATLSGLIDEAARLDKSVAFLTTAPTARPASASDEFTFMTPDEAKGQAQRLSPKSWLPDRRLSMERISALDEALSSTNRSARIFWFSDGLDYGDVGDFSASLENLGRVTVFEPDRGLRPLVLMPPEGTTKGFRVKVGRSPSSDFADGKLLVYGDSNRILAITNFDFEDETLETSVDIDMPLELRNQVRRIEIEAQNSAGSVVLIDDRWQRQLVGLIANAETDSSQPLLSEIHYLEKALEPFAELRKGSINTLIQEGATVLVLADTGQIVGTQKDMIDSWVSNGGLLIRFAGPRMAAQTDDLLPVPIRQGGRALGGALSWNEPQPLSAFDQKSPFFGLTIPDEVAVGRQVLAQPGIALDDRTWARLQDGTPLVTSAPYDDGRIVLFHITANPDWSNLPLSGLYVEMLQRTIAMAGSAPATGGGETRDDGQNLSPANYPPQQVLDGFGDLQIPDATVETILASDVRSIRPEPRHPPGYYGTSQNTIAINTVTDGFTFNSVAGYPGTFEIAEVSRDNAFSFQPTLLVIALTLMLIDGVVALFLSGKLRFARPVGASATTAMVLVAVLTTAATSPAPAQDSADEFAIRATEETPLAYVITGNREVDEMSRAGLVGLSRALRERTAMEPAAPMAVNVEKDELSFFPLLYWPVVENQQMLSPEALAKVDLFMKNGGTILFDTQDHQTAIPGLTQQVGNDSLKRLLSELDIPPLETVPEGHVLTKAFYLLQDFPGRWSGGRLWVEAGQTNTDPQQSTTNDGVSAIVIGSNDYSAAWAEDANGRPLAAVVPGGERQREFAIRFGVNLVMYTLTGNYKADQVHVPALLERLGQ